MTDAFTRRLRNSCGLNDRDADALRRMMRLLPSAKGGSRIGVEEGGMVVIISGVAFRGTVAVSGAQAVTGILLPGDICNMGSLFHVPTRHEVMAITDCEIALLRSGPLMTMCLDRPSIMQALLASAALEHAILREWIVATSRLDAGRRTARLFCELHARLMAVDPTLLGSFALPLTQALLADVLGLSVVHMNRTLKRLKHIGLVAFHDGVVTVLDNDRLMQYADFDPSYLSAAWPGKAEVHLGSEPSTWREKRYLN